MNPLIHTSNYDETLEYLSGWGKYIDRTAFPLPVIAFLDIAGNWDASLAFVMAAAIPVTMAGYALGRRLHSPLAAPDFSLPARHQIDGSLVIGAILFGVGWGWWATALALLSHRSSSATRRQFFSSSRCWSAWPHTAPRISYSRARPSMPDCWILARAPRWGYPSTMSNSPVNAPAPAPGEPCRATISRARADGSRTPISTESLSFLGSPATYIWVINRSNPRPATAKWMCGVLPG